MTRTTSPALDTTAVRTGALTALALAVSIGACSRSSDAPGAAASASAPAPASAPSDGLSQRPNPDDEDKPIYPREAGAADPLAQRLCDAIHEVPAARRAACCASTPGFRATAECVRVLSFALRANAVALEASSVDACAAAVAKAYDGCDWVGPSAPATPAECQGIVKGKLPKGDRCRSSLDCQDGLRCLGVAATRLGKCGPPQPARGLCGVSTDALAGYLFDGTVDAKHPECASFCEGRICRDFVAIGGECTTSLACGVGRSCRNGKCAAAAPPIAGEACADTSCASGLRCVKGACRAPKAGGEPCAADLECRGACERGTCGKRCDTVPKLGR